VKERESYASKFCYNFGPSIPVPLKMKGFLGERKLILQTVERERERAEQNVAEWGRKKMDIVFD
jgi:hypothetical protein